MDAMQCDLSAKNCKPCEGGVAALGQAEIDDFLAVLPGWTVADGKIVKTYGFKNYYETIAFVNATAWVSQRENHHPDLEVSYGECKVAYSTHAIGGLSENDFVCAAKIDALLAVPTA